MLQGSLFSTGMCVLGQATNRCPSNDNKFWTNRTGMGKQSNLGHHCLQYHLQHFKDFLQGKASLFNFYSNCSIFSYLKIEKIIL